MSKASQENQYRPVFGTDLRLREGQILLDMIDRPQNDTDAISRAPPTTFFRDFGYQPFETATNRAQLGGVGTALVRREAFREINRGTGRTRDEWLK